MLTFSPTPTRTSSKRFVDHRPKQNEGQGWIEFCVGSESVSLRLGYASFVGGSLQYVIHDRRRHRLCKRHAHMLLRCIGAHGSSHSCIMPCRDLSCITRQDIFRPKMPSPTSKPRLPSRYTSCRIMSRPSTSTDPLRPLSLLPSGI